MAAKYFVQPLLAQLLQKRDGSGPAGLRYLPEISDTTAIPEGVDYFYYTGEDHDQYINGYIYKHVQEEKEIIIPEHTEPQTIIIPTPRAYIDVLQDGYAVPKDRYYLIEELPKQSIYYGVTNYIDAVTREATNIKSSDFKNLNVGDYAWNWQGKYKIVEIVKQSSTVEPYILLENGVKLISWGASGAVYNDHIYMSDAGIVLYYHKAVPIGSMGVIRANTNPNIPNNYIVYCDGLYAVDDTARLGTLAEDHAIEIPVVIPEHSEWVTVDEWKQWDAQPRAVQKIESTDGTKYVLVTDSGAEIQGDALFKDNVTVKGNLLVEGTEIVTDVETVQSEDDFIKLRFNNPAALGEGQSGLQVLNFDGNGATMFLVVGGDGILRLGLGNELEPVTTRDEAAAMVDGAVTVWNAAAQKIKTGPAAAELVTSEEINTLKALGQAAYDAITTKDINTAYFII